MHILSFDIEDWFHLLEHDEVRGETSWAGLERRLPDMLRRILDLLDETGRKATFFCLGWVAREFPELIREIDARGHEIGSHSDVHSLIFEQSPAEFARELARSKSLLEPLLHLLRLRCAGRSLARIAGPGSGALPAAAMS